MDPLRVRTETHREYGVLFKGVYGGVRLVLREVGRSLGAVRYPGRTWDTGVVTDSEDAGVF